MVLDLNLRVYERGKVNVLGDMGGIPDVVEAEARKGGEGKGMPEGREPGRPDIEGSSSSGVDWAGLNSSGSHVRSTAISFRDIVPVEG
jgi:hypothetical protein